MSEKIENEITLVAVIDVGSSAIRYVLSEIKGESWRVLDSAERPVSMGADVFSSGKIKRKTINQALDVIDSFSELMKGYPVDSILAIGTSALREATNRDTFIDRVLLRTGIEIQVIEGIEANQLTYVAVRHALQKMKPSIKRSNAMVLEVAGGSTELMLMSRGKMIGAHTLPIGTVRLKNILSDSLIHGRKKRRILKDQIKSTIELLEHELPLKKVSRFVAVGGDARLVAHRVNCEKNDNYAIVSQQAFADFLEQYEDKTIEEIIHALNISHLDADSLITALTLYSLIFEMTSAKEFIIPMVSTRDGLLLEYIHGHNLSVIYEFNQQVIAAAESLAMRYHADLKHARQVAHLSHQIYDAMIEEHGLHKRYRFILEVASILHDIGSYINKSAHHKHGQYIIMNTELFGLTQKDLKIIALIVRYHRKAPPQKNHAAYMSLSPSDRMVVTKLSAIIRIAELLDRGHGLHIADMRIEKNNNNLILHCETNYDLSLERIHLKSRATMFEDVYGLRIVLP